MRSARRATVVAVSALVVATVVTIAATMPPIFTFAALAGTTLLIMGGTGHSLATPPDTIPYVQQYIGMAENDYVLPSATGTDSTGIPDGPYNSVAVITPEEHAPNYGTLTLGESIAQGLANLDNCITSEVCHYNENIASSAPSPADSFVVFGYSQSATIAMLEKARLTAQYAAGDGPDVSFVVIGNARPNGGLGTRDTTGIVAATLFGVPHHEQITEPAPTDTQYSTVDIAIQYGFTDIPLNPLNLLADLNAYMGIVLLHTTYGDHSLDDPGVVDQGQYGDTHYYMIGTDILPILHPVQGIPVVGPALADSWDPVLRVIVESAYDRSISPGKPTPFDPLYFENPITFANDLLVAIPTGLDNGIEHLTGVRPLSTQRPDAYGVGGPEGDSAPPEPAAISDPSAAPTVSPVSTCTDCSAPVSEQPGDEIDELVEAEPVDTDPSTVFSEPSDDSADVEEAADTAADDSRHADNSSSAETSAKTSAGDSGSSSRGKPGARSADRQQRPSAAASSSS